jgi:glutaredoxin-like YruB-family protein
MTTKNIIIYSTQTCPFCVYAKNYFIDKGVAFEDVDLSTNPDRVAEMIQRSGQRGVPVIDIDGDIIIGFQPDVFDQLLSNSTYE